MNSWPTNENDAGQILAVALSVLLDVCVKVQNYTKMQTKRDIEQKIRK
jgi:hypothetical protein